MSRHERLITFGRGTTAEGCPIEHCARPLIPFTSDREAIEHIAGHSTADMAWALLEQKAVIAEFLDVVDEEEAEDLMKAIGTVAARSRRDEG
ncbi:hypothetical protein [Streptomyces erythrochromogenes]|uniref:hypothetical protein n=1 Tax=Streptomyces erythrochromogenes TaxID=285574 RepID=UPI00224F0A21|nr:hypothetical protein [Streptomyces erythrochromogenes]MCX5587572.1 hypothetical protein [Streptomyces erythrochromogenes]